MKTNNIFALRKISLALLLAFSGSAPHALAALADLADGPLSTGIGGSTVLKPNLALVIDDSGSMDWEYMPDAVGSTSRASRCWSSYLYNTLSYNPAITYKPPFKLDGATYTDGVTRYPNATFTSARIDGYFPTGTAHNGGTTGNGNVNLNTISNTPSGNFYYTNRTVGTGTNCAGDASYAAITSPSQIAAPGVANGSAAALTNYANWFSYYSRRAFVLKAGIGEAFKGLDTNKFRVGMFFINGNVNADFRIDDFTGATAGTHRYDWFDKLYRSRSNGNTPLRPALAKVGRMYAGKINGFDPVQYSCQPNYTILSTDGFWNQPYDIPKQIDGITNIGNQDGGTTAVGATARLNTSSFNNSSCHQTTSLTVDTGSGPVELLASTPVTMTCSGNGSARRTAWMTSVVNSINANTGTTGFSAAASGTSVVITAPTALGNFAATPSLTWTTVGGGSVAATAFGGAVAASGEQPPIRDGLNIDNTLADVAAYYYKTDLRTPALGNCSNTIGATVYNNLCDNNVLGSARDPNTMQHMTTFTVGLGVSGEINYEQNYETAPDGPGNNFYKIKTGAINWPSPGTGSNLRTVDDLWHAAVNGRGRYYSAGDSTTLRDGLMDALNNVQSRNGTAAASAVSNTQLSISNSYYLPGYRTGEWTGDIKAGRLNAATGEPLAGIDWSAQAKLDARVAAAGAGADGRTIKYFSPAGAGNLQDFNLTNLTADSLLTHFQNICAKTPTIDQCGTDPDDLTLAQKATANTAGNLINYLRGQSTYEDEPTNATGANRIYRGREHVLGDIVNSAPAYVATPHLRYAEQDATYAAFRTLYAGRLPTVYAAANDGMLHALDAATGEERWAYVPRKTMSDMWRLADRDYGSRHHYLTDGSPVSGDICTTQSGTDPMQCASATAWKTILVGGFNKGGCGYYALDVNDPANPKGLWEFTNPNLGYSYGNPIIVKRGDGRWVVIFTSGYNNVPGECGATGDGNGHVFVVDALTGALLADIPTYTSGTLAAGTVATPSNLGKVRGVVDPATNLADRLYAGDMKGNLWRIDYDDNYGTAGNEAHLLARLRDASNNPQPITIQPEVVKVKAGSQFYPVVMIGTGRYLGVNDMSDVSQQTLYGIKDKLDATTVNVRGADMKARILTQSTVASGPNTGRVIRTVSGASINWASDDGWYMDLNPGNTSPGERINIDMVLNGRTLVAVGNVPNDDVCDIGGYSYLYFLDVINARNLLRAPDGMAGMKLGNNALGVGIGVIFDNDGKKHVLVTDSTGRIFREEHPEDNRNDPKLRRSGWREIED